jgi:hypothetical protein
MTIDGEFPGAVPAPVPQTYTRADLSPRPPGPSNLADILERVLDKGIVIAGDIQVNLLEIELLTIRLRLLIASVDRAREMGINWWEADPTLSVGADRLVHENRELRTRLENLERRLENGSSQSPSSQEGSSQRQSAQRPSSQSGSAQRQSSQSPSRRGRASAR